MDAVQTAEWHDFFAATAGAAAALTGLLVVAISLHLDAVIAHPAHAQRAKINLTSLAEILIASLVVLIPTLGSGGIGVAVLALTAILFALTLRGAIRVWPFLRRWSPEARRVALNTSVALAALTAELVGAVGLIANAGSGLALIALGMLARFALAVIGAWLLLVAVADTSAASSSDRT